MAYRLCTDTRVARGESCIKINAKGVLSFNPRAAHLFDVSKRRYFRLYYDDEDNTIGMEPFAGVDTETFKLSKTNTCSIGSFFTFFNLDLKAAVGTYRLQVISRHAFLIIDLNNKQAARTYTRKKEVEG